MDAPRDILERICTINGIVTYGEFWGYLGLITFTFDPLSITVGPRTLLVRVEPSTVPSEPFSAHTPAPPLPVIRQLIACSLPTTTATPE